MNLKYHYSILGNVLFFIFGALLLFFGLDQLFLQTGIFDFIINQADTVGGENPKIGFGISVFLGILLTTGFLKNLIKGKKYVLEANEQGLTIHTGNLNKDFKTVFINWENFIEAEIDLRAKALGSMATNLNNKRLGFSKTQILVIKIKPNTLEWPKINITKDRVFFEKADQCDKIIIDAWLNKHKMEIVDEINNFTNNQTYSN